MSTNCKILSTNFFIVTRWRGSSCIKYLACAIVCWFLSALQRNSVVFGRNPSSMQSSPKKCLNCGTQLEPDHAFCPSCGQATRNHRLSFWQVINDILVNFFALDSKVSKTLWPLISSPGKITESYNSGQIARYVPPMRMYLTVSILFFFIQSLNNDTFNNVEIAPTVNTTTPVDSLANDLKREFGEAENPGLAGVDTSYTISLNNSFGKLGKMVDYAKTAKDKSTKKALEVLKLEDTQWNRWLYREASKIANLNRAEFTEYVKGKIPLWLFLFLPVLAWVIKLAYIRHDLYYFEHLIFVYHVQTFLFILLTLTLLAEFAFGIDFGVLVFFGFIVYVLLAMKRVYLQSWRKTLFKFFVINMGIAVSFFCFMLVALFLGFIFYS